MKINDKEATTAEVLGFLKQQGSKTFIDAERIQEKLSLYLNKNYYNLNPLTHTLLRLEQIRRNVLRWRGQVEYIKENDGTYVQIEGQPDYKALSQKEYTKLLHFFDTSLQAIEADIMRLKRDEPIPLSKKSNGEGLRFIALKHLFSGSPLPEGASEKLKAHYNYYSLKSNRIGNECSNTKRKNKIALFEKVKKSLPKNKRLRITAEIKILQEYL